MRTKLCSIVILALCCLIGCSALPQPPLELPEFSYQADERFGEPPALTSPADIHRLTAEQASHFLDYYHDAKHAKVLGHQRIADYLSFITVGFAQRRGTHMAADSLRLMEGNCMSLAILTTAFADLADIKMAYQLMDDLPVFSLKGTIAVKGVHIRTRLYKPNIAYEDLSARVSVTIDYFPSGRERFIGNLSTEEYFSRYYLNLAADAITQSKDNTAYWLSLEALKYDPLSASAFNNLAILYRRKGDYEKSEAIYQYALNHLATNQITLLTNYQQLLVFLKRESEAQALQQEINARGGYSPLDYYHLADEAYEQEEYQKAIRLFKKALGMAPYLHEVHFGLAKSYFKLGDDNLTKRYLTAAMDNAGRLTDKSIYAAKLAAINNEIY